MPSGPYGKGTSHDHAFADFATRMNTIVGTEIDAFFTQGRWRRTGLATEPRT